MKMTYRGVNYDYEPLAVDVVDSGVVGQYRGQAFTFAYPRHIPVPQPIKTLTYRGVSYRTTPTGATQLVAPTAKPSRIAERYAAPVSATRQTAIQEVARIHQLNLKRRLDHRLSVAREKGDQSLISQLEREMQQIM